MTEEFCWPVDITGKRYAVLVCDGCDCHFEPAEGFLHCKTCELDFHCNQHVTPHKYKYQHHCELANVSFLFLFRTSTEISKQQNKKLSSNR